MDGTGKSKAGYDKIRFCGQQAKRDGLQCFWVDTCCIDKSNNVELQEAINCMFRWYRNAATAEDLLRTHVLANGLAVRPWRTHLVALLHLPSFFRFDVLVTVHLYDPL